MKSCPHCAEKVQDSFKFCPSCGADLKKPGVCVHCQQPNEPGAKFCQECGQPLGSSRQGKGGSFKAEQATPFDIPPPSPTGITIEFSYSSAQSFDLAVKEAKKLSSFEQFGVDKKAVYRVSFADNELYKSLELTKHMGGWRKRVVYVNGEKVTWDSVFSFDWCYERKLSSFKPDYYCFGYENNHEFNLWGCMQAMLPFSEYSALFTYGKWLNKNGDWQFDKERIKHELSVKLYSYRFCPALNPTLIQEVLDALPAVVNPNTNKNWKFREVYHEDEGDTISITVKEDGYRYKKYFVGVVPNGRGFVKDISDNIQRKLPDFIRGK